MALQSTGGAEGQHLITYEPGDATHYAMSVVPAHWVHLSNRLGHDPGLAYWQIGVWSGAGLGNGTMIVEAGTWGSLCLTDEFVEEQLRCSAYSVRVWSILIHGCLASHDLAVAQEQMAQLRARRRNSFIDPDAIGGARE